MNKFTQWLAGAASVLAAIFANAPASQAASGEAAPPEKESQGVSDAARGQIGITADRIGRDDKVINKPVINPGEEVGRVTFVEADPFKEKGTPFVEGPSFLDLKSQENGQTVNPGAAALKAGNSLDGTPPFDEGTPPFDEFKEVKPDERQNHANPVDVQGSFDKNQVPQAPQEQGR